MQGSSSIINDVEVCVVDNAVDILTNSSRRGGTLMDAEACVPYLVVGSGHQFRGSFAELGRMIVGKSFGYDYVMIDFTVKVLIQMIVQRHEIVVISDHPFFESGTAIDDVVQTMLGKDEASKIILLPHVFDRFLAGQKGQGVVIHKPVLIVYGSNKYFLRFQKI